MEKSRCPCCNKEKPLIYCHECYWNLLFQYMALRGNEDLAQRIKWDIGSSINEALEPFSLKIEKIEEVLKMKNIKNKKKVAQNTYNTQ